MAKYRNSLPLMGGGIFLLDGGLETTLVFDKAINLPEFAAFVILQNDEGSKVLKEYYQKYISIAVEKEVGFILESPTWRASSKWGKLLDYSDDALDNINHQAIQLLCQIRCHLTKQRNIIPLKLLHLARLKPILSQHIRLIMRKKQLVSYVLPNQ